VVLNYKHVTIVNDNCSVISKGSFKLIDDPRVIIYDRHRFLIQASESAHLYEKASGPAPTTLSNGSNKLECLFMSTLPA